MKTFAMMLCAGGLLLGSPAFATPGGSIEDSAARLADNDWTWSGDAATGPLSVVISLPDQRAYVYRGGTMIAAASASTGRDGKETPTGTFPILQKKVTHKSNRYHSASMPYMERLTWDGVAIHAGKTPGIPTSHGCVHVPTGFARKLYAATRIGTVVSVTDSSVVATDPSMLPPNPYVDSQETADANSAALTSIASD